MEPTYNTAVNANLSKSQPPSQLLARFVHRLHPPPRPLYGPGCVTGRAPPSLFTRLLYQLFPPPLWTDVPWYNLEMGPKFELGTEFYSHYTGLSGAELALRLRNIRDRAWAIAPYPCIGQWSFLLPGLSSLPVYSSVQKRAQLGATVLDLGCGLGQDLRRLAASGATKLYAVDVRPEIWELGLELFGDKEKPVAKFLWSDAWMNRFAEPMLGNLGVLDEVRSSVDVIIVCQFIDLFHWPDQLSIGKTIVELSKVGTQVVGYTRGTVTEEVGEYFDQDSLTSRMFHDYVSFRTLWWDIGQSTGTKWKVEADLVELSEWGFEPEDINWMKGPTPKGFSFVVTRTS